MSDVLLAPGASEMVGPLDIALAGGGGVPMPNVRADLETGGNQTMMYGEAADDAGVDTAIAAYSILEGVDTGYGNGAVVELTFDQITDNTAWVAWIATSTPLSADPTGFTKKSGTTTKDSVEYTVYTQDGAASVETLSTTVAFTGDAFYRGIGYQDACSITESGITIAHGKTVNPIHCLGSPGVSKYVITQRSMTASFELQDMTAETYAEILGELVQRSDATSKIGTRRFNFGSGSQLQQFTLVARGYGLSPYLPGEGNVQWYIPYVVEIGSPSPVFTRSGPAMLTAEFGALENRRAGRTPYFGTVVYEDRLPA